MSDHLQQELLSQFLKKLSVKTLLTCRSVCKWWKEVIDSQSFIADHLALQKPRLIAQNKPFKYLVIDPHTLPNFRTLTGPIQPHDDRIYPDFISSVHGIICLCFNRTLHLWNPSLRRLATLPLPDFPISEMYTKKFGFWIDPSNNHWKIVMISNGKRKFHLYSSRKEAWTEVASDVYVDGCGAGIGAAPRQVLINGVTHWAAYIKRPHGVHVCLDGVVAYFDFTQDEFGAIAMPYEADYYSNVCNWRGSLSLAHWDGRDCVLWGMQDGSWSKMFSVRLVDRVTDVLYWEPARSRILAQTDKYHLVLYDPAMRRKRIRLRSESILPLELSVSYEFVESLVFPGLESISSD